MNRIVPVVFFLIFSFSSVQAGVRALVLSEPSCNGTGPCHYVGNTNRLVVAAEDEDTVEIVRWDDHYRDPYTNVIKKLVYLSREDSLVFWMLGGTQSHRYNQTVGYQDPTTMSVVVGIWHLKNGQILCDTTRLDGWVVGTALDSAWLGVNKQKYQATIQSGKEAWTLEWPTIGSPPPLPLKTKTSVTSFVPITARTTQHDLLGRNIVSNPRRMMNAPGVRIIQSANRRLNMGR